MGTWGHDARAANSLHRRRSSCLRLATEIPAAQLSQQTEGVELKLPWDEISSCGFTHPPWGGHLLTQPGSFRTNIFIPSLNVHTSLKRTELGSVYTSLKSIEFGVVHTSLKRVEFSVCSPAQVQLRVKNSHQVNQRFFLYY